MVKRPASPSYKDLTEFVASLQAELAATQVELRRARRRRKRRRRPDPPTRKLVFLGRRWLWILRIAETTGTDVGVIADRVFSMLCKLRLQRGPYTAPQTDAV